jgi:hypothetical protein
MPVIPKDIFQLLLPQVMGLAFFGLMGFGPKAMLRFLLFWGNRKKADAAMDRLDGFQGAVRFFFWIGLVGFVIQDIIILFQKS